MDDLFDEHEVIYPRSPKDFSVVEIPKKVAAEVYRRHHYFGEKDFLNLYSYGAVYGGYVLGAISFGIPNAKNIKGVYTSDEQKGVLEIVRLAFDDDSPKFSESRLIGRSIRLLRKKYPLRILITYADTAQSHVGTIYKATNFEYIGLTAKKTDFLWPDGKIRKEKGVKYSEMEGEWVPRSQKHLFVKRFEENA